MKTVKLYDINPYRDEFTAKVISCGVPSEILCQEEDMFIRQ